MNSAIIIMTLLGCSDGAATCEYIGTVETTFESRSECEAQTLVELRHADFTGYPSVVAVCEPLPEMAVGAKPPVEGAVENPEKLAEPEVVFSSFDKPARTNPLTWTFDATRKVFVGMKNVAGSTWRVITGRKSNEGEPVLLGRYSASDV